MLPCAKNSWHEEIHLSTWRDLCHFFWDGRRSRRGPFIYRGESSAKWKLNPGLLRRVGELPDSREPYAYEREELWLFKADAHRRSVCSSSGMNDLEWLALLQHNSGLTRLLDWTYSPFIAAWFAARGAARRNTPFVIWQLRSSVLTARARELAYEGGIACEAGPEFRSAASFRRLFMQRSVGLIAPVVPSVWNQRMAVQQGLFLCGSNCVSDYTGTFKRMFAGTGLTPFTRIVVDGGVRQETLSRLDEMNIHAGVLLPGLEGTAERLKTRKGPGMISHPPQ